jgi:hypothetical protein
MSGELRVVDWAFVVTVSPYPVVRPYEIVAEAGTAVVQETVAEWSVM